MVYECDECGAVLSAHMTRCPGCEEEFDAPVPSDATNPESEAAEQDKPEAAEQDENVRIEPLSLVSEPRLVNPLKVAGSLKMDVRQESLLPEKVCPQCSLIQPLANRICRHCGHRFRTRFLTFDGAGQPLDPNRTQMFMSVSAFTPGMRAETNMGAEVKWVRPARPQRGTLRGRGRLGTGRTTRAGYRRWMLIGLGLLLCAGAAYAAWDVFW